MVVDFYVAPGITFQWDSYAYVDKAREAKRVSELQKSSKDVAAIRARQKERAEKQKVNAPWSSKTFKKEEKDKRKEKKERKKQWIKEQTAESKNMESKKRDADELDEAQDDGDDGDGGDDWAELAREERLAKKVKKGHLSQDAFDEEFALL